MLHTLPEMPKNRWKFFVSICACAFFLVIPAPADLYAGPAIPICTAPGVQIYPAITISSGEMLRIAWEDNRNGDYDIYMLEHSLVRGRSGASKEKVVYQGPGDQKNISMFGNYVVWDSNQDIYAKNLKTGALIPVCTNPSAQSEPEIYGTYVVWQDRRNGNWDIYMKNLKATGQFATETAVHTGAGDQMRPDIWCDPVSSTTRELYVVWDDTPSGSTLADIYWKDMLTGYEVKLSTPAGSNEYSPRVSANHVMWNDWRNGNWDIYGRQVNATLMLPESAIVVRPFDQLLTDFFIDTAVFFDTTNGSTNLDVYAWDAHEGGVIPVNTGPGTQAGPAIFKDIIVYYDTPDNSQLGINMTELIHGIPSGLPLTKKVTPKFSYSPSTVKTGRLLGMVDKTDLSSVRSWVFYKWDFNGDGKTDSNLLAPITSFGTPGIKTLKLAIGLGPTGERPTSISKTVSKTVTVT